jgi:bacillithiol system protein YtxJ
MMPGETSAISALSRPEEVESLLAGKATALVFKHSTRCPISAEAERQVRAFASAHAEAPVYRVLVIEDRPASLALAERLGVPHASPQAILVREGRAAWSASHWDITREALEAAWSEKAPASARKTLR